jgi:MoaA/NifB/PqqE/SkfB family radical SAM enzyme
MLSNFVRITNNHRHLKPRVAVYYVTAQCNLNCAYCEDFGSRRNAINLKPAAFDDAKKILNVIRGGADSIMLTGGEPFTNPDIDSLIGYAKRDLRFRELTLITNGTLIDQHAESLPLIDRLIISLDSIDSQRWSTIIGASTDSAEMIVRNIRSAAKQKGRKTIIINAVITPETLSTFDDLIQFCIANNLLISFSPQSFNNFPRYDLMIVNEYKTLIETLIALKKRGAPIAASMAYLQAMQRFEPYDCYPTLVPRIYPNGDLAYPCRPLEKADNGQGGRAINLLNVSSWDEAWAEAYATYGEPPRMCHSCFQQCYAEPSLMQARPLTWLYEKIFYSASRKGNLITYAPG